MPADQLCKNPRMSIVGADGRTVASNDDWTADFENANAVRAASAKVGDFPLTFKNDAATLVSLAPGVYTVVVTCESADQGTALVEVYEVPADF